MVAVSKATPMQRRKRGRKVNLICVFVSTFLLLWIAMILWAQNYAATHNQKEFVPNNGDPINNNDNNADRSLEKSDESPYFGWQPQIADTMECSWKACMNPNHDCTSCVSPVVQPVRNRIISSIRI